MFSIKIPTSIDFVGQHKAERFFQILMAVFAVIGFAWGFYVQQFSHTMIILASGVVITCLAILPPWPFWNRNPLKWQKPAPKTN